MKVFRKKFKSPNHKYFLNENLSGFTLIEILVVITIIGILVTVFLTSINPARTKARDVAFKQTASSIASAATLCCSLSGSPALNEVGILVPNPGNINICVPDINSIYPDATQVKSVSVNTVCSNSTFWIIITPGTLNSGNCDHADCTEEGCTYDGC